MPTNIVLANLDPQPVKGNSAPLIATDAERRDGSRAADPVVPGPSEPGQTIRITGSGFEGVSNPLPTAYDTFSDYQGLSSGDPIPEGQNWEVNGGSFHSAMVLDSQVTVPGRSYSAKTSSRKSKLDGIIPSAGAPTKTPDRYYMTFMARANQDINQQPTASGSIALKWCRLGTDGKNQTRPTFEQRKQWAAIEDDSGTFLCPLSEEFDDSDIGSVPGCTNDRYVYGFGPLGQPNRWVRVEFEIRGYTVAKMFVDGVEYNFPYRKSPDDRSALPKIHVLGTDVGTAAQLNESYRGWIAEVYESVTPARVELSNSPVWSTSTEMKRYFQKTITRTNDLIEFEVFLGDLDPEAPLYAYIVKSDGSVNQEGVLIDSDEVAAGSWENN